MTAHDDQPSNPDEVVPPPPSGAIPPPPAPQPPLAPPVGSDASAAGLPAGAPRPPHYGAPGTPQPSHGAQPAYGAPAAPQPPQYQPPQGNGLPFQPPQYQPPQPYRPTPAYHPGSATPTPAHGSPSGAGYPPAPTFGAPTSPPPPTSPASAPSFPPTAAASTPTPAHGGSSGPGYPPASGGSYPPGSPTPSPLASGSSYPPNGSGYPAYPSAPSPTPGPKRTGLVVGLIALGAVVVIGGIVTAAVLLSNPGRPEAVPSPVPTRSETTAPTPPPTPSSAPSAAPSEAPPATDPGSAEAVIQGKIDEYKAARQDGSLWERIPNTEFNQTAVSAFLYLLTDMKVATIWGGDASEYLGDVEELERKLLAGEPLGSDIRIVLEDRTFTYDGDTGEGGYTDN